MLPQRSDANDIKTAPDLESNTEQQLFIEDFLQPLRFNSPEDVYKLLLYLIHTKKISITDDGRIDVHNKNELMKEFVVDVNGETYLFGMMRELINNNTITTVKLDMQQEPDTLPKLAGQIEKQLLMYPAAFDVDIQLKAASGGAIPFMSLLEQTNNLTYNQVLAHMIEHLNPNPYGMLNVIQPMQAYDMAKKILLPINFHHNSVMELKDNLAGITELNHAALTLIILGMLQKESRHRNMPADKTLRYELESMQAELRQRIVAAENAILAQEQEVIRLVQDLEHQVAHAATLRRAHDKHVLKHPKYGLQKSTAEVNNKNEIVKSKYEHYKTETGLDAVMSIIGLGLLPLPYDLSRLIHYKRRLKPYQAITDFRQALNEAEITQKNIDGARYNIAKAKVNAQTNKTLIENAITIIDMLIAQVVRFRARPPMLGTSVITQTIFHQVSSVTITPAQQPTVNEELQVPNKEFFSPQKP